MAQNSYNPGTRVGNYRSEISFLESAQRPDANLALGPTAEPDNTSESSAENRDNLLGAASLAAIRQARNSLLRVPSETVVQYQDAPVDHPSRGMPEVITFPTPGDASSEGSQQSRPLQALASGVNSTISDITGQQIAALHLPSHQHIPVGHSYPSDHQAASAQLHLQPIPIQQFQVGASLNAYSGIVGNLQQQPGFFIAPTTYPGTMMMMMFPMSQQITGESQPAVFAMPNIMLPLQQTVAQEPARLGSVRQTASSTMGTGPASSVRAGNKVVNLFLDFDSETLTEYQCLLRKQIELFEAGPEDIQASAQGRNSPILLGQVGIRCRYCATVPIHSRPRGFAYYSRTVDGMYQVAQNMSKLHFCKTCRFIPRDVQISLVRLQQVNRRAAGGKEYWAEGLRVLGVYEDGKVMRFRNSELGEPSSSDEEKRDTNQTCDEIQEQGLTDEGVTARSEKNLNETVVWDG